MKSKTFFLFVMIFMIVWHSGCSIKVEDIEENNAQMYSRADTRYMSDSELFGKGHTDDIYVALDYIYSDESIREVHGSDFEIESENITCHTSESKSYFFAGLYKGYAEYSFVIDNRTYRVKLTKELFEGWVVTECITE